MVPKKKVKSTVAGDGGGEWDAVMAPRWEGRGSCSSFDRHDLNLPSQYPSTSDLQRAEV